jgi:hypothetical protein
VFKNLVDKTIIIVLLLKIMLIMDFEDILFFKFFSRFFFFDFPPKSLRTLRVTPVCSGTQVENRCCRGMQQSRKETQVRTGNKTGSSLNLHHFFSLCRTVSSCHWVADIGSGDLNRIHKRCTLLHGIVASAHRLTERKIFGHASSENL